MRTLACSNSASIRLSRFKGKRPILPPSRNRRCTRTVQASAFVGDSAVSTTRRNPEFRIQKIRRINLILDSGSWILDSRLIVNCQLVCDVSFDTGIERVPHGTVFFTRKGYCPLDLALLEVCPLDFEVERQAGEAAGLRFRALPFDARAYGAEAAVHLAQNMDDVYGHASRERHHQGFHRRASFATVAIEDKPAAVHGSLETKTSLPLNLCAHRVILTRRIQALCSPTETRRTLRCTENPLNCGLRIADCPDGEAVH